MAHHHDHSINQNTTGARLFVTMMMNFIITITEVIGGIYSGSLSLISDALHNFSDGISIIISYIAIRLNRRPKDMHYTFGMKRAEIFAAIINSTTLIIICFYLFRESYERFSNPEPVSGGLMIIVALVGLAANIIGTLLLKKGAKGSMNIRSTYLHLLSDAVFSIGVVFGGIMIHYFSIYWMDPLLTVLISIYVLRESFHIVKEAVNMMMMATPANISIEDVSAEIKNIENVINIHHVHLWQLNEHDIHFEAHVDVMDMPVSESQKILSEIESRLHEKFDINHVTAQFECDACDFKSLVEKNPGK